jgi:hypothetical protein
VMTSPDPKRRHPLLGLVAYLLVPGERRVRAARHFGRAGVEVLKGVGSLVIPEKRPENETAGRREHIEID